MRKRQYLVRINKDPVSDWGASVPDLPGCVATGKTIDVALRRIQEAIEIHLQDMREDGLRPPRPRPTTLGRRRETCATGSFLSESPAGCSAHRARGYHSNHQRASRHAPRTEDV